MRWPYIRDLANVLLLLTSSEKGSRSIGQGMSEPNIDVSGNVTRSQSHFIVFAPICCKCSQSTSPARKFAILSLLDAVF